MGMATSQAFAAGAAVVMADVNTDALTRHADTLTTAGHRALPVTCDVADETSVAAAVRTAVDTYGRLDMAFNNAGIQVPPTDAAASRPRSSTESTPSTYDASGPA